MKQLKSATGIVIILLTLSLFPGCIATRYGTPEVQTVYENPPWAPPYYQGVRYYYLPDIECYYDIYSREFIFLDHAQWIYSPDIPYMYPGFDLHNCFVVVVNSNVYQPWMHHQYYVSHFPRYYYRDYYDHGNIPYVRGYDENNRSAIYWGENERNRARNWDDQNLRNNRQFRYSREDRLHQNNRNERREYKQFPGNRDGQKNRINNTVNSTNPPLNQGANQNTRQPGKDNNNTTQPAGNINQPGQQPSTPETKRTHETNYYGKPIGQPVKVERQMRNQNEKRSGKESSNSSGERRRESNSGRR